jgi:hypothetical protein
MYEAAFKYSMKALLIIFTFLSAFTPTSADAQKVHTFSGSIKNAETGEDLIGALIIVRDLKTVGVASNAYGFYSLTVPEGMHTLVVQFIGFRTRVDSILFNRDMTLNFELTPELIKQKEVVVTAERSN